MQMIPSDLTHHTLDKTIYVPTTNGKSFSNTEANAKTKQNSLTASSSLMALYSLSSGLVYWQRLCSSPDSLRSTKAVLRLKLAFALLKKKKLFAC